MTEQRSYTTEEIAKLLKVSKLTVYDLIKKGELQAYRVGRQMRVDEADLQAYKIRTKGSSTVNAENIPATIQNTNQSGTHQSNSQQQPYIATGASSQIVITGQDISLDILSRQLEGISRPYRILRSNAGSLDSLISMYKGEADIVSTHLLDGDTGEYNIPYIRKILVGFSYVVIHLISRWAGLYVQTGNPKNIQTWEDLKRSDIRLINREKGSGARVLLDEQLRLHHIRPQDVYGYTFEENNHISVAGKVASGDFDVGIGIEKAAQIVGVEFIPLIKESYDLVIIRSEKTMPTIDSIQRILHAEEFQNELKNIRGYDLTDIGRIIYEA